MLDFQFYLRGSYPEVNVTDNNGPQRSLPKENAEGSFSHYLKALSQKKAPSEKNSPLHPLRSSTLSPQSALKLPSLSIASYILAGSASGASKDLPPVIGSSSLLASQTFFLAVLSETRPSLPFPSFQKSTGFLSEEEYSEADKSEDVFLIVIDHSQKAFGATSSTIFPFADGESSFPSPQGSSFLSVTPSDSFSSFLPAADASSFSFSQSVVVSVAIAPNVVLVSPPPQQNAYKGETPSLFQLILHLYNALREESPASHFLHYLTSLKPSSGKDFGSIVPFSTTEGVATPDAAPVVSAPVATPDAAPVVSAPVATPDAAPVMSAPVATPDAAPVVSAPVTTPDAAPVVSAPVATPDAAPVVSAPVATPDAAPAIPMPMNAALAATSDSPSLDTVLLVNPAEIPVVQIALKENDIVIQDKSEPVKQIAVSSLLTFYLVSPTLPSLLESFELAADEEVVETTVLQQSTFLYQMVQTYQKSFVGESDNSRKKGLPSLISWSTFTGLDNHIAPDMQLVFPFQETPFFAALGRLTVGTLERSDRNVAVRPPEIQPLQLTHLQTGTLSSVVTEFDNLKNLVQKPEIQALSAMTFGDFLSIHESYEAIDLVPAFEQNPKASSASEQPLPSTVKPSEFILNHSFSSFMPAPGGAMSIRMEGGSQVPTLSFASTVSDSASSASAPAGRYVLSLLDKAVHSLPPDAKASLKSFGESPHSALEAGGDQGSSLAPRINLSASQVIQAINQNIPIHIADFSAFVSRVLQVQPPTVTQPQTLQVTLSPDSLGKIMAQFELTAQNTVNITLLSQSALTVNKLNTYLQEIQQIIGTTQFSAGQIIVRQGIPLAKQSQSFDQQSQSERDSAEDTKQIQRRGGQRRRRGSDDEISIDVTV